MKGYAINILLISGAIGLMLFAPLFVYADPLDSWHLRYSLTPFDIFGDIAYGNGTFVTVGAKSDYVALGATGMGVAPADASSGQVGHILTSPDGITWTERTSGTTGLLKTVAYGNGTFVVLGYNNLLTSPDGITWTARPLDASINLTGVIYAMDAFFAVGRASGSFEGGGTARGTVLTSPDGVTWTQTILEKDPYGNLPFRVAWGNNTFVAVGTGGLILTSTDGITWTERPSGWGNYLHGIAYGNDAFVATGENGIILTSPDGITWKLRVSGYYSYLHAVTYGNGTFVAVGAYGTILQTDVAWSSYDIPLSSGWNFISIPLQPANTTISEVLKDASQDVRIVWGYDNQNKQWKKWKPEANSQQTAGSQGMLSTIEPGKGYWIYTNNDVSMNISGSDASPSVALHEGWNLAGYPGVSGYLMGLSSIMYKWDIIWSWDQGIWSARAANPLLQLPVPELSTLNRGKAYWIKMNAGASWTQ